MGPQERYYEHLMRNTQVLRTSVANVNEAMHRRETWIESVF